MKSNTLTIGRELRDRIQQATQEFALAAIFEVRAAPLVDARKATNELLSAGKALRNEIEDEPAEMNGRFYAFHLILELSSRRAARRLHSISRFVFCFATLV